MASYEVGDDDYENLAHVQRLKAAVHYTVGQICEEVQNESDDPALDKDFEYSKQVISVIAETTYRYMSTMATDLELFAKHAKRNTINSDDVKLMVRKSPKLHEYIKEYSEQVATEAEEKRKGRQQKKKSSTASKKAQNNANNVDEDSNL